MTEQCRAFYREVGRRWLPLLARRFTTVTAAAIPAAPMSPFGHDWSKPLACATAKAATARPNITMKNATKRTAVMLPGSSVGWLGEPARQLNQTSFQDVLGVHPRPLGGLDPRRFLSPSPSIDLGLGVALARLDVARLACRQAQFDKRGHVTNDIGRPWRPLPPGVFIGLRRYVADVIHALTLIVELNVIAPAAMLAVLGFRRPNERWSLWWGLWRRERRSGVGVVHTVPNDRAEEQRGNDAHGHDAGDNNGVLSHRLSRFRRVPPPSHSTTVFLRAATAKPNRRTSDVCPQTRPSRLRPTCSWINTARSSASAAEPGPSSSGVERSPRFMPVSTPPEHLAVDLRTYALLRGSPR